jgi:glycosyltransferase involved in cell wall biosynthesis
VSREQVELAVVVPVYRCSDCLLVLHERLTRTLRDLGVTYEILFVDDRSPDDSWPLLADLADRDATVRALRLSRNFGQQAAITAGLAESRASWTVVMDCDLQDPPEFIPQLYAKAREGHDVVLARRRSRSHSVFRLLAARIYFAFLRIFLKTNIDSGFGAFSIISRKARSAVLSVPDADRHYVPILLWVGFERASIEFEHAERYAGKSAYSMGSLVRLALSGIFFQTASLLRWIIYLGFLFAFLGVCLAVALVASYLFFDPYPGWTSLAVLILVTSGFIIASTGVSGLYIGMIFKQVKNRPLYVIDETAGGEASALHASSEIDHAPTLR